MSNIDDQSGKQGQDNKELFKDGIECFQQAFEDIKEGDLEQAGENIALGGTAAVVGSAAAAPIAATAATSIFGAGAGAVVATAFLPASACVIALGVATWGVGKILKP